MNITTPDKCISCVCLQIVCWVDTRETTYSSYGIFIYLFNVFADRIVLYYCKCAKINSGWGSHYINPNIKWERLKYVNNFSLSAMPLFIFPYPKDNIFCLFSRLKVIYFTVFRLNAQHKEKEYPEEEVHLWIDFFRTVKSWCDIHISIYWVAIKRLHEHYEQLQ